MRAKEDGPMATRVYVLTLKTWKEYDRAHHTYGRIHWYDEADGFGAADSESLPDEEGFCTIRHDTRQSAIDGALRWFEANSRPGDTLVCGAWGLAGWESDQPFDVLAGPTPVVTSG
jgi:hypothetical protein